MKLATYANGTRDGELVVVSTDLRRAASAADIVPNLAAALDDWSRFEPLLRERSVAVNQGRAETKTFDPARCMAPLPRTRQFVDASAFLNHGGIMEQAYNLTVKKEPGIAVMVQRQADDFRGPCGDYEFPTEADQCDFEGEYAVITDDIAMGAGAQEAQSRIRLVTILNDVSMRKHLFRELQMGFGLIQAKPATVFAPVAVTPDELGDAWQDGRVHLDMRVHRNGKWFGNPNGREMDWSFGQLLAHLAYNRNLRAGLILGSGTVSNRGHREVGSACLAERRAVETIDTGAAQTPFMAFGERLRFEVLDAAGTSVFGAIDQCFVPAGKAG